LFDIGPAEFIGLATVALIVFGPDRLPGLAGDAGRLLRRARQLANGAKQDLRDQLGDEFTDLQLSDLTPRRQAARVFSDPDNYTREPDTTVDCQTPPPPQASQPPQTT